METEIAIITTEFLKDFVELTANELTGNSLSFKIYPYTTFSDLPQIYKSIPERVRGVVTSGSFPAQVIRHYFPGDSRILVPFNNDNAGLYKLFLQLLFYNRNLELNRAYADILDVVDLNIYEYLLGHQKTDISVAVAQSTNRMTLDELINAEEVYANKHLKLWDEGKIDLSITRFSSIMPRLQEAGLPVYFAYPSTSYIRDVLVSASQDVIIRNLRENQPAAILINPQVNKDMGDNDIGCRQKTLLSALKRFIKIMQIDFMINQRQPGFEIITDRKTVDLLTNKFNICRIQEFLKTKLDFEFYIGYGIGGSLYQARINAVDAHREAGMAKTTASRLINDRDELIAPLVSDNPLVIPRITTDTIKELANRSGLSCFTIQKVFSVAKTMENNQITSDEMAHKLAITKRSANRFLSKLNNCGLASVVERKQITTKGRPELVYKIFVESID